MSTDNIDLPQKGEIIFLKWDTVFLKWDDLGRWLHPGAAEPYIIIDHTREGLNPYSCKIYNVKSGIMLILNMLVV